MKVNQMASPTKKRKRNDTQQSLRGMRSIASYFGGSQPVPETKEEEEDAKLARKLQAEWNRQDVASPDPVASTDNITEALVQEKDPNLRVEHLVSSFPVDRKLESTPPICLKTADNKSKGVLSLQNSAVAEDAIALSLPFDQTPLTFESAEYAEKLQMHWASEGRKASYAVLVRAFTLVNNTQSRIKIVDILVNALRVIIEGDPESLLAAVWLTTNAFAPPYVPLELGLGGSAISKALKKAYGLDNQGLKTLYDKHGDAGDVAFEAKKRQTFTLRQPKPLTIQGVYDSLVKIATSKGQGSQEMKQRIIEKMLQGARGAEESRYIVRTLVQHLRIGAVKTTILIALARAFLFSRPPSAEFPVRCFNQEQLPTAYSRAEELVKACYARHPNYNDIVPCLLRVGVCDELLATCGLTLHIPLMPMLGSITRDLPQMLTKLHDRSFTCEYKYDGQRAQVHCDPSGDVSIFSRHLELMTDKYPDLVTLIPQIRGASVSSFILEGEVVAVNQESGDLLPFQVLTNRAKKNVEIGDIKVNVCLFAFDLMYLNGQPLLERPFRERRELLRSLFTEIPLRFTWVKSIDAFPTDTEAVLTFFNESLNAKCEGIMVKVLDDNLEQIDDGGTPSNIFPATPNEEEEPQAQLNVNRKQRGGNKRPLLSTYEPDKRLESWLKVKKDYNATSDTLDLIPIAAWHGQGRKAKWWSPILLAVRNPETGSLEAITKCMSGFTDKFYEANKEKYAEGSENVITRPGYVEYGSEPEVWFEPQEVWEIAFADITLSPTYTAAIGLVSEDRGLSLRFPRFLRVRTDKSIDEASTSDYLAQLWQKQVDRSQAG